MSDNLELAVRKRTVHGVDLWWIMRKVGKDLSFYSDIHAPTGYGFKSKAKAEKVAGEIEEARNT